MAIDPEGIEHIWWNRKIRWSEIMSVYPVEWSKTLEITLKPGTPPPYSTGGYVNHVKIPESSVTLHDVIQVIDRRRSGI